MAGDVFPQIGTPQADRGNSPLPGAEERQVFTRPVTGPSPADFLDNINYRGLEKFGAATQDTFNQLVVKPAVDDAAQAGAQSVSRDPATGQITVGPPHEDLTVFGRAYNDAANKTYVLQTDAENKTAIQQIYLDNADDPQKAQILANKFVMASAQKAPEAIRAAVLTNGQQASGEYLRGSILNKHDLDIKKYVATSKAAIDDAADTFVSLAGTPGGSNTPNFAQAHAAMVKGWMDLGANPLSGYTPETAQREIDLTEKRAQAEAILSHQKYGTPGLLETQNGIAASAGTTTALDLIPSLERSGDAAISPKGAVGRYQIMPATAKQYGFDPARLTDPAYSKAAATVIVNDLSNRYHGDMPAILAGYNAGPGAADRFVKSGHDVAVLPKETQAYLAHAAALGANGGTSSQAQPVQGQAETEAQIMALHLPSDETLALVRRSEGILSDADTKRRQAEADTERTFKLQSDATLHAIYDHADKGDLTSNMVDHVKDNMNAADYHVALELARGGGLTDDRNTVADLTLSLDTTPPEEYKQDVAKQMRLGKLSATTGRGLIEKNASVAHAEGPDTPYKQGSNYVRASLDPGPAIRDYGGRQAQANALTEYDAWAQDNPNATPNDAVSMAHTIVNRYSLVQDNQLPLAIGRPYGFAGSVSTVSKDSLSASAAKLKQDRQSKRIGEAQYLAEVKRLTAWQDYLARQATTKPKAPQ